MARPTLRSIPGRARLPLALLALAGLFILLALVDTGSPDVGPDPGELSGPAERQVARAVARLHQPGLYVAPQVPLGRLNGEDFDRLREQARAHPAQVRVAVLPAGAAREATVETLVANLHEQVGEDGIYAVVVDRDGKGDLAAFQWTEKRPYYAVEQAATSASECCARDYPRLLAHFLKESEETKPRPWITALVVLVVGVIAGAAALFGFTWWRRSQQERMDSAPLKLITPELAHELTSIEQRLLGFPTGTVRGNDRLGHRYAHARMIAKAARTRFDEMRTLLDADEVIAHIADFRFQVVAIEALRQGLPAPERQPPCVVDPRHGPSSALRPFAPNGGDLATQSIVQVCGQCADVIDRGQQPIPRRLPTPGGDWAPYWAAGRIGEVYVNGYRVIVPFLSGPPTKPAGVGTNGGPVADAEMTD